MRTTTAKETNTATIANSQSNNDTSGDYSFQAYESSPHFSPYVIQTKLKIGQPNDKYEQEADAMADKVMRMPDDTIQRTCSECEREEEKIQMKTAGKGKAPKEEEELLQTKPIMMKSEGGESTATPALATQLNSTKGGGKSLAPDVNASMSNAFGTDFSHVRVHTDTRATQMNQDLHAKAFTHGSDIYFNQGEYAPTSSQGKKLLAHELTHVIQQKTGGSDIAQRSPDAVDKENESQVNVPHEVIELLDGIEKEAQLSVFRLRDWLTKNMIEFLGDVIISDRDEAVKKEILSNTLKTAVGNAVSIGSIYVGAIYGEKLMRYILTLRQAKAFGGVVSFIVGAFIETVAAELFNSRDKLVKNSLKSAIEVITTIINPKIDKMLLEMPSKFLSIRNKILAIKNDDISFWRELEIELQKIREYYTSIIPDTNDKSLYRSLALQSGVYSDKEVPAESELPENMGGKEAKFNFLMRHNIVDTKKTKINVSNDSSTIIIKSKAAYSAGDTSFDYVEWPPSKYQISLIGIDGIDSKLGIPRIYNANSYGDDVGYGIWYNVPKGTYSIEIMRSDHPIAIRGECAYIIKDYVK